MKLPLNRKNKYIIITAAIALLALAVLLFWLNYNSPESRLKRLVKAAPEISKAYQVEGVSLKLGQDDPNGILVQVGNPKAKEFLPELNISRWGGEVNFKMSAASETETHPALRQAQGTPLGRGEAEKISPEKGSTPSEVEGGGVSGLNFEGEKIKYDLPDQAYEFYQSVATSTDGGGYNFDVLVKTKPASNIFSFNIETSNLDFFYQPPLNDPSSSPLPISFRRNGEGTGAGCTETDCIDKDGKVITHRPENVVGSYAVYYKDGKSGDYTALGGKNYMAGKAFHIYRPQIIDANGNKVWGELKVDEAGGKLTVTIPQDFLDSAVYPVTIDPTFGKFNIGASTDNVSNHPVVAKAQSNPSLSGTLTGIGAYIDDNTTGNPQLAVAIYSDNAGVPQTRLASTETGTSITPAYTGWLTSTLSYSGITAGTAYWLGFKSGVNGAGFANRYDTGTDQYYRATDMSWPDPFGGSQGGEIYTIYAIYSAATPTNVYYSVGQNTYDHKVGSPTLTIDSSGVGTFSVAQTASTTGVGDLVVYGGATSTISGKISQTQWTLTTTSGQTAAATTSATVTAIKHAFNSLSAALNTTNGAAAAGYMGTTDLTASGGGYILNIPCYYDTGPESITAAVIVDGYTTDSTHYIKIYTPSNTATEVNRSQRHNGKWDTGKYNLYMTSGSDALDIYDENVWIDGLQIRNDGSYDGIYLNTQSASAEIKISNCIVRGDGGNNYGVNAGDTTMAGVVKVWNTVAYDNKADGFYIGSTAVGTFYCYNCTSVDNQRYGFDTNSGTMILKNCLGSGNTIQDFLGPMTVDYSASADDTATLYGGTGNRSNQHFLFADYANDNFHLAPTDPGAKGYGTNLSADTNLSFSTDIDGQTRSGSWDIGADQFQALPIYRSVGPNNTTALASSTGAAMTIDNNIATFSSGLAANVGVGDVIVYNGYSTTAKNSVAFISGRSSNTVYSVQDVAGRTASSTYATTNWQVFRAATSLSDAESGTENTGIPSGLRHFDIAWSGSGGKNLASSTEQWNIAAYGDAADTNAVTIDGWTTTADNYIKIYTPYLPSEVGVSQRHSGKWDSSKYNLVLTNSSSWPIYNYLASNLWIDGLQIFVNNPSAGNLGIIDTWGITGNEIVDVKISNNIIKSSAQTAYDIYGIVGYNLGTGSKISIWNNLIYDLGKNSASTGIIAWGSTYSISYYVYNNTVVNAYYGYQLDPNYPTAYTAKNNIAQNCINGFYESGGSFNATSDYNLSDIAGDAPGSHSKNGVKVQFVNAASKDFHLAQGDASAIDQGTNLSTDANLAFSTDIDGQPRPMGPAWDIGADETRGTAVNTPITNRMKDSSLVLDMSFNGADMNWASTTAEALDRSGQNNNGNVINFGKEAVRIGQVGQTLQFDGSNDYVTMGDPANGSLDFGTGDFSVSFWIKIPIASISPGSWGNIVQKGWDDGASVAGSWGISQYGNATNQIVYQDVSSPGSYHLELGSPVMSNGWHYVVFRRSGTEHVFYIDGSKGTPTTIAVANLANSSSMMIGGGYFYCKAFLDEVRIYNRALSAAEVSALYQYGAAGMNVNTPITKAGPAGSSLVGNWSFNGQDMGTTSARDMSGNNNTGWLINGVKRVTGISGQALSFDGVDDEVSVSNPAPYSNINNLTISAWIKPSSDGSIAALNGGSSYVFSLYLSSGRLNMASGWTTGANYDGNVASNASIDETGNNWTFVTGVYQSSTNMKLYINGALDNTSGLVGATLENISGYPFYIGIHIDPDSGLLQNYFPGLIDEVRIYNRALSVSEIMDLYRVGSRGAVIKQ